MKNMAEMETNRLRFRLWREDDAEELLGLASDSEVGPMAGWPPHGSVEESLEVIRTVFASDHVWALELKETGRIVGCMGYYTHEDSNIGIAETEFEVGYWIGKEYWNRGYCTEALRAMIEYCFGTKQATTLWCDYFVDNPASGRVMSKCGFVDTGRINWLSGLYLGDERPVKIMRLDNPR